MELIILGLPSAFGHELMLQAEVQREEAPEKVPDTT